MREIYQKTDRKAEPHLENGSGQFVIMKDKKLFPLIRVMLEIGLIGFGGGTALIPVIEKKTVEQYEITSENEFNKEVMIASITPGALPVEVATGIGYHTAGNVGMVASAISMALPGSFLMLFFLVLLSGIPAAVQRPIRILAAVISVYIIFVLARYAFGTLKQAHSSRERYLYLFIILAVFLLSGEQNIYDLFHIESTPVFSVSTIQILGAAFFVILFTRGYLRMFKRSIPAMFLAACYFLCAGDAHLIPYAAKPYLVGLMTVLAGIGLVQAIMEAPHNNKKFPVKKLVRSMCFWGVIVLLLSLPALLMLPGVFSFMRTGFLSSFMSFGGGDAYLTVARGLFVDSGIISHSDFYGTVVTAANVLPGSILCKILTGIGYMLGYEANGSVLEGISMGLCGFITSVAASGTIYMLVWALYEKYRKLRIFDVVKHFIRPIISGLLLNVGVSLYLTVIQTLL